MIAAYIKLRKACSDAEEQKRQLSDNAFWYKPNIGGYMSGNACRGKISSESWARNNHIIVGNGEKTVGVAGEARCR